MNGITQFFIIVAIIVLAVLIRLFIVRKLIWHWIKEIRWARKHYGNGVGTFLLHKLGWIISPSLSLHTNTFKEDKKRFRKGQEMDEKKLMIDAWVDHAQEIQEMKEEKEMKTTKVTDEMVNDAKMAMKQVENHQDTEFVRIELHQGEGQIRACVVKKGWDGMDYNDNALDYFLSEMSNETRIRLAEKLNGKGNA